jgi:hypothetical protein
MPFSRFKTDDRAEAQKAQRFEYRTHERISEKLNLKKIHSLLNSSAPPRLCGKIAAAPFIPLNLQFLIS